MALTTAELQQCKHWLGYGNLTAGALPYFDIATVFEDVVGNNVDTSWAEGYLRTTILPNLIQLDADIMACRVRFQAVDVFHEVRLFNAYEKRNTELNALLQLKDYWIQELSKTISVPIADGGGGYGPMEVI